MQKYNTKNHAAQSGFTLIELVITIVILGVLAAIALPKFVNMGKGARIAAVNSLAGGITSAATIANSACLVSTTCAPTSYMTTPYPQVVINGKSYWFSWGYPTAWGSPWVDSQGDIGDWLTSYPDFTKATYVPASYSVDFTRNDAPDPSTCKVTYRFVNGFSKGEIAVTTTTTGC